MSYRRAWLLLEQLNGSLRRPAVATAAGGAKGGGSALTEVGFELLTLYRRIDATATEANQADLKRLQSLLRT